MAKLQCCNPSRSLQRWQRHFVHNYFDGQLLNHAKVFLRPKWWCSDVDLSRLSIPQDAHACLWCFNFPFPYIQLVFFRHFLFNFLRMLLLEMVYQLAGATFTTYLLINFIPTGDKRIWITGRRHHNLTITHIFCPNNFTATTISP